VLNAFTRHKRLFKNTLAPCFYKLAVLIVSACCINTLFPKKETTTPTKPIETTVFGLNSTVAKSLLI
jgi:hypothetical protein